MARVVGHFVGQTAGDGPRDWLPTLPADRDRLRGLGPDQSLPAEVHPERSTATQSVVNGHEMEACSKHLGASGAARTSRGMTPNYGSRKWHTARTWPGDEWGSAMAQVRKGQHPTQRDVADFVGASSATVRKWEDGIALPDRSFWTKLEEALGVPVPDPRTPDHTPAERELIDTLLLATDELRQLREQWPGWLSVNCRRRRAPAIRRS
jgi:transcriptional regulator with XRE-family HTH domain